MDSWSRRRAHRRDSGPHPRRTCRPAVAGRHADDVAATAFVPLVTVDGVIGTLLLGYDAPPTLSTEEQQLAAIIAAEVAFALERTALSSR